MLPDLKVDVPQLEPPPVLLEQLARLSQMHTSPVGTGGPSTLRTLMAAAIVAVVGGVSWLTGTLPGVASPFSKEPAHRPAPQHAPADPSPSAASGGHAAVPSATPPTAPPGRAKPHHDNGHHTGQTKPHHDNGHHTGQTKPHHDNGPGTRDTAGQPGQSGQDHGQSGQDHGQDGQAAGQS